MGILVIMLMIALLASGTAGTYYDPADYAICQFRQLGSLGRVVRLNSPASYDYAAMVISVLLIGLGFLLRVVKLHRGLSVNIVTKSRNYLSAGARTTLKKWYENNADPAARRSSGFRHLFCYCPALAVFLAIRAILDLWSSLFFEVSCYFHKISHLILFC